MTTVTLWTILAVIPAMLPSAGPPMITELNSVDELRARFNAERGTPRIVLFLSPT